MESEKDKGNSTSKRWSGRRICAAFPHAPGRFVRSMGERTTEDKKQGGEKAKCR